MLFGFDLEPDLVILINGRNDLAVGMDSREGPLAFKHYAVNESFITGYSQYLMSSSFYRRQIENRQIKKLKIILNVNWKKYIPKIQNVSKKMD